MTEHTKTDGLPGMDMPVLANPEGHAFGKPAAVRNAGNDGAERAKPAKVECNACPVLCQISEGRTGACDRYANRDGVLMRVDPVVLLRRELSSAAPALVAFDRPGAEADGGQGADPEWNGDLLHSDEVFVTGSPAKVRGPIAGTGAESWVDANPAAYQELARRYLAGLEPIGD